MKKKQFEEIDNALDLILKQTEKKILLEYSNTLKTIKAEISELYEKYGVNGRLELIDMQKYDRIKRMEKMVQENINEMFVRNRGTISIQLRSVYTSTFLATKDIIEDATKKTLRAIVKPVNVTKTINAQMAGLKWGERLGKQREDLIYTVQKAIKEGLDNGDVYRTMAERINVNLGKDAPRALTIARTEGARVLSQAQKEVLDTAQKQGIVMVKTWNTVKDERVRGNKITDDADHVAMEGVTIPYDDDFVTPSGSKGWGPRLLSGPNSASDNINCRCWLSFELV